MRQTIKKHSDFLFPRDAASYRSPYFTMRARPTKWDRDARFGIVAAKKVLKLAIARNRAKRLIRAWLNECADELNPNLDYVFIVRADILNASKTDGVSAIRAGLAQLK
jgi:ribonuclease P protein component